MLAHSYQSDQLITDHNLYMSLPILNLADITFCSYVFIFAFILGPTYKTYKFAAWNCWFFAGSPPTYSVIYSGKYTLYLDKFWSRVSNVPGPLFRLLFIAKRCVGDEIDFCLVKSCSVKIFWSDSYRSYGALDLRYLSYMGQITLGEIQIKVNYKL